MPPSIPAPLAVPLLTPKLRRLVCVCICVWSSICVWGIFHLFTLHFGCCRCYCCCCSLVRARFQSFPLLDWLCFPGATCVFTAASTKRFQLRRGTERRTIGSEKPKAFGPETNWKTEHGTENSEHGMEREKGAARASGGCCCFVFLI